MLETCKLTCHPSLLSDMAVTQFGTNQPPACLPTACSQLHPGKMRKNLQLSLAQTTKPESLELTNGCCSKQLTFGVVVCAVKVHWHRCVFNLTQSVCKLAGTCQHRQSHLQSLAWMKKRYPLWRKQIHPLWCSFACTRARAHTHTHTHTRSPGTRK